MGVSITVAVTLAAALLAYSFGRLQKAFEFVERDSAGGCR